MFDTDGNQIVDKKEFLVVRIAGLMGLGTNIIISNFGKKKNIMVNL